MHLTQQIHMITKFFKEFSGNKAAFISGGHATTYANNIVFIKDEANSGAGACIYARGSYFGNFAELIAALSYIKNIKVGANTYSANGGATLEFASTTPSVVTLDVSGGKVTISLTPAFVQSVTDVIAEVATIKGDYLKAADKEALQKLVADTKAEIIGKTGDASSADTIYGVRKYVDEKTADIASNTDFSTLKGRVDTIEGDYLKAADKNELQGNINTEKGRIDGIVADYLKGADKTELSNAINTEKGRIDVIAPKVETLIGSDANMSARAIVQDEVAKQLQSENITESFDTLKEMAEYLSGHPQTVTEMNNAIKQNADDIDAIEKEMESLATSENLGALELRVKANEDAVATVDSRISAAEGRANAHAESQAAAAQQAAISHANTELAKKADKATTYTKTEVDGLLSPKADKSYVDEELAKKADKATTYTKDEVAAMFDSAFGWEKIG